VYAGARRPALTLEQSRQIERFRGVDASLHDIHWDSKGASKPEPPATVPARMPIANSMKSGMMWSDQQF
jgi:hypothetical protein